MINRKLNAGRPVVKVGEVRMGRNWLRAGDPVKVKPSKPGKRDGFVGTFRGLDDAGSAEVFGAPQGRAPATRTLPVERLQRVAVATHARKAAR